MRTSQDVRRYATEHGIAADEALAAGMREKAEEFNAAGGRVYLPIRPAREPLAAPWRRSCGRVGGGPASIGAAWLRAPGGRGVGLAGTESGSRARPCGVPVTSDEEAGLDACDRTAAVPASGPQRTRKAPATGSPGRKDVPAGHHRHHIKRDRGTAFPKSQHHRRSLA